EAKGLDSFTSQDIVSPLVEPLALEAERRQLTVMFCDLVGCKVSANPCQEVSSGTPRHHGIDSNGVAYASNARSGGDPSGNVRSMLIRSKVSGYHHGTIRLSVSKRTSRISRHQEVSAATGHRVNGTGRANS